MIEKLFPHQETGKNYLLANRHSCLFWEVGTGKTNTVIAAVNSLPRGKLLILSPAYVMRHMWEKYSDLPINHDVGLKSYEYLRGTENSIKLTAMIILSAMNAISLKAENLTSLVL